MALVPRNPRMGRLGRYTGYPNRCMMWPAHFNDFGGDDYWPLWGNHRTSWLSQSRDRFFETERRFENFMQNVDKRFSGMLSLLDIDEDPSLPIAVEHDGKEETAKGKGRFSIKVNVQDFKPEEVTVKVAGGKALVHAKRESKNEDKGMYAYTFREFKREFSLPKEMKTEDITSSLSEDGILKIEGAHVVTPAITDIPIAVKHAIKE